MDEFASPTSPNESTYNRKRTSHACDYCRHRKVRCDGRQPCTTCATAGHECLYGVKALPKSRGDQILDVAIRSERLLNELKSDLTAITCAINSPSFAAREPRYPRRETPPFYAAHPYTRNDGTENMDNATISTLHNSTTESILEWPYFDQYPFLRTEHRFDIFHLEQSRPTLPERSTFSHPLATTADIDRILDLFQQNVNMWYPTMCRSKLEEVRMRIISRNFDNDTESCLALLIMALGCASGLIVSTCNEPMGQSDSMGRRQHRVMAEVYVDGAMKMIHRAFVDVTTDAVHCLFFASIYYAFLQRPLQGWNFLSAAATKCHLFLVYPRAASRPEEFESIRRIFWSCYILESNYLAELAALPQSGLGDIESSIPLPREFDTHSDPDAREKSSLYFLACISMRRLLNRVHHLLYAKDTGATFDDARFPSIVAELSHQLDEWKDLLPPEFQFTVDTQPTRGPLGGFLRQRYLTCRSVIFRPYLMWALVNCRDNRNIPEAAVDSCNACLDACVLHILNLRSFPNTVMIDTWICALSMASAMLILLAASQLPDLRPCIATRALLLGPHLEQLLRCWMYVPGASASPSVEQSVHMISRVHEIFKDMSTGSSLSLSR